MLMRPLVLSLLCCLLLACGGNDYRAPIEDRRARLRNAPSVYVVRKGETLYSISWRYGLDYRRVAAANGIDSSYTIFPGQKLYLKRKPPPVTVSSAKKTTRATASRKSTAATSKTTAQAKPGSKATVSAPVSAWLWPTSGQVERRFSGTVHKGVDISGKRGDQIRAVAGGQVVYAGTGIVGYGELLIVKHNDLYLSAYGHNDKLLVREGASVRAGQVIAKKGSTGTNTVKLHFEIRKEGKPVDPLRLLPAR